MTTARRFTALATALFALSAGVSAATLPNIDFEKAGAAAIGAGKPGAVTAESDTNARLTLSGAWGYAWRMLDAKSDAQALPGEFDAGSCVIGAGLCNEGGFIVNRDRGATNGSKIVLELDKSNPDNQGVYFQSIIFDLFTYSSVSPKIYVYDDKGNSAFSDNFKADDGNRFWAKGTSFDVSSLLANVTKLEFDVGASTIGLDNLKITLTAAIPGGGGGSVPEPASYALVGLALLAAGASRRRSA